MQMRPHSQKKRCEDLGKEGAPTTHARFFLEAPFAEVLSGLLWTAYWPLVFLFSPIFGVVLARSFFPHFSIMDSKAVQRSALCRSLRELSNEYLLAKFGFDTAENNPCHLVSSSSQEFEFELWNFEPLICSPADLCKRGRTSGPTPLGPACNAPRAVPPLASEDSYLVVKLALR